MNFRDPASSTDCFRGSTYNVGLLVLALGLLVHPAHRGFLTIMRYTNPCTCSLTHSLGVSNINVILVHRPIGLAIGL